MTRIINLYGGPGTGKSTMAAFLYSQLKEMGINAELVREYVKDWAWDQRKIGTFDQIYFLGKQVRRESMLYGKVDWIITDSPVALSAFYAKLYCSEILTAGIEATVKAFYDEGKAKGHEHVHIMLERTKAYKAEGRYQNEAEARECDVGIEKLLKYMNFQYSTKKTEKHSMLGLLLDHM